MSIFRKSFVYIFLLVLTLGLSYSSIAQIGSTQPPSANSGVGQNNGSPFNNTSNGGSANGSVNADADGPGGPTDPPDDVVPIDGGVTILLAIGLVHGFFLSRKKRKQNFQVQLTSN